MRLGTEYSQILKWPMDLTLLEIKQVCSDLEESRGGNDYVNNFMNYYKKLLRVQIKKEAVAFKKLAEIKQLPAAIVFTIFEFGGAANLLTGLTNAQLKRADRNKSVPNPENNLYGVLQCLLARQFPEARKQMQPFEHYQGHNHQATEAQTVFAPESNQCIKCRKQNQDTDGRDWVECDNYICIRNDWQAHGAHIGCAGLTSQPRGFWFCKEIFCKKNPNPSWSEVLDIELPEEYKQKSDIEVYVLLLHLHNPNCCIPFLLLLLPL